MIRGVGQSATAIRAIARDPIALALIGPTDDPVAIAETLAHSHPHAALVLLGPLDPTVVHALTRLGARAYFPSTADVPAPAALVASVGGPARLEAFVREGVGHRTLPATMADVRRWMIDEALGRHDGRIGPASRTLGVTRQALQRVR